ncbi:Abi-alpha family protein [Hymenobacter rigui]|uniref:DUF4393 domain-containing protein n=1 Tax=Hymenobacter rigui TaxID=334424 RepID=A0A428KUB1_9BACT|nr:Abi-alpha family protein [Hymenobacter rigui]RSK50110.1 DUF4393 domain-containing protein [Hymenobacter rigui]
MASDLITLLEGAALTKFIGPAAEHYGKAALERAQHLGAAAYRYLANVGREAAPVAPNVLVPLVQAAALEIDETLAAKWAALLANAADPEKQIAVTASYVEVLRQLSSIDAQVLEHLYTKARPDDRSILDWEQAPVYTQEFPAALQLSPTQVSLSVETLLRLRLCTPSTYKNSKFDGGLSPIPSPTFKVCPTVFGYEFLRACMPPLV